jgi:hypothetical protein
MECNAAEKRDSLFGKNLREKAAWSAQGHARKLLGMDRYICLPMKLDYIRVLGPDVRPWI